MKYLLVILLILVVFWLWRSGRPRQKKAAPPRPAQDRPAAAKQVPEMVACGVCHVHLPRSEALPGPGGFYCSEAHRRESGT